MKDLDQALAASVCPVDNCDNPLSHGSLMCRSHWWMVPRPLRDDVWTTWRSFLRGKQSGEQLRHVQVRALEEVNKRVGL
jgi:hypothetical protein